MPPSTYKMTLARVSIMLGLAASPATAGSPETLQVTIRTVDNDSLSAALTRFSLEEGLRIQGANGEGLSIAAEEVVEIAADVPPSPDPSLYCLTLFNGDKLYGRISGGAEDHVLFDTSLQQELSIPMETISSCLTPRAARTEWAKTLQKLQLEKSPLEDRVLMANGDVARGFVSRFSADEVVLERDDRLMPIKLDVIVAVLLATDQSRQSTSPSAVIHLVEGSTLTVSRFTWLPDTMDLTFFNGTLHDLSAELVHKVEVRSGKWQHLTTVKPMYFHHTPVLSLQWPLQIDHNVLGDPLTIAGRMFEHGFGVHSRTILRFKLNGQYRQLRCFAGVDDSAGPLADVTAAIKVDEHVRWDRRHLKKGMPPIAIHVDLTGANVLELSVDYGNHGDIQDRFNWADPILVR